MTVGDYFSGLGIVWEAGLEDPHSAEEALTTLLFSRIHPEVARLLTVSVLQYLIEDMAKISGISNETYLNSFFKRFLAEFSDYTL